MSSSTLRDLLNAFESRSAAQRIVAGSPNFRMALSGTRVMRRLGKLVSTSTCVATAWCRIPSLSIKLRSVLG